MAGTIVINFAIGLIAFIITFLTAIAGNVWQVSIERAFIAFLVFFIAGYIIRWITRILIPTQANQHVGNHIDMVTPVEQEAIAQSAAASEQDAVESFAPFQPPRLERTDIEKDPDQVANIIRQLADE
ncbi:MAG: hypothetical protein ACM32O_17890 [Clostridia bacterium]